MQNTDSLEPWSPLMTPRITLNDSVVDFD